jgi:hypothetical protein
MDLELVLGQRRLSWIAIGPWTRGPRHWFGPGSRAAICSAKARRTLLGQKSLFDNPDG